MLAVAALSACITVEASAKSMPRQRIMNVVNGFRTTEGFEVVNIGRVGIWLMRSAASLSGETDGDPELVEAMKLLKGINRLVVVEYEDGSSRERRLFNERISSALDGCDLLMSASDEGSSVHIYGSVGSDGDKVRDLVVFTPDDGALVCVFGSFSMDSVARLANM